MRVGVVIPVGAGRKENVIEVVRSLGAQTIRPETIVLVLDGHEEHVEMFVPQIPMPKHEPGMEHPRNVGVRYLDANYDLDHVWFVDSDVILDPRCLESFHAAHLTQFDDRILVGPYDWLPPGHREPMPELRNDPRWPSFNQYEPEEVRREDLAAGLACFSGNLVWPIAEFKRVGGFWNELHHGRCEDGELGLRAVAMGVGISFAREARGWHLSHEVNGGLIMARNARDVPMLNARHPWVQGSGLLVVEQDGKRFDVVCGVCGGQMNTAEWWSHAAACSGDLGIAIDRS